MILPKNWSSEFPTANWCLVILADEKNQNYFNEIINKSIEKNVGCICSVGKQHDFIHDLADEEIVFREVDIENLYLPEHLIITIGTEDFENGIWSGIYLTENNETKITQTVIIDLTKQGKAKTKDLIKKLESGYLPK
jgi:thiamine phosphate synthase YjbQ (UPF0047 family)